MYGTMRYKVYKRPQISYNLIEVTLEVDKNVRTKTQRFCNRSTHKRRC